MTYFRELPNVEYENFLESSTGSQDYILTKNLFLRGKLRDDLAVNFVNFTKYTIGDGERPDQIAEAVYGSADYDWVVLISAGITNVQNEFPLSSQQLYDYVTEKYGVEGANDIAFYETTEVKDRLNRLILPAGVNVDKNFTIPNPDDPALGFLNPVLGVTNWEYENRINEEKRTINILNKAYLNQFVLDMRDLATYKFNSEFVNPKTIRVANTKNQS